MKRPGSQAPSGPNRNLRLPPDNIRIKKIVRPPTVGRLRDQSFAKNPRNSDLSAVTGVAVIASRSSERSLLHRQQRAGRNQSPKPSSGEAGRTSAADSKAAVLKPIPLANRLNGQRIGHCSDQSQEGQQATRARAQSTIQTTAKLAQEAGVEHTSQASREKGPFNRMCNNEGRGLGYDTWNQSVRAGSEKVQEETLVNKPTLFQKGNENVAPSDPRILSKR